MGTEQNEISEKKNEEIFMLLGVLGTLTTKYITFVGMNLPEIMHPMVYYSVLT